MAFDLKHNVPFYSLISFFSKVRFLNKTSKRLISETPTWSQPLCFENTLEWNVLKFKKEPPVLGLLVLFVFLAKGACQIQPNFVNGLCPSEIKLWSKLLFTAQIHPLYLWICRGQNGVCDSTRSCSTSLEPGRRTQGVFIKEAIQLSVIKA